LKANKQARARKFYPLCLKVVVRFWTVFCILRCIVSQFLLCVSFSTPKPSNLTLSCHCPSTFFFELVFNIHTHTHMPTLGAASEDYDSEYSLLRNNFHFTSRRNFPYKCGCIAFALLVIVGSTLFALYLLNLLPIMNTNGCPRNVDGMLCSGNGDCTAPPDSPKICTCTDGFIGKDCSMPATNFLISDLRFDLFGSRGLNWTIPIHGQVGGTYQFKVDNENAKLNYDFTCGSYQCYQSNCGVQVQSATNTKNLIIKDSQSQSCVFSIMCVASGSCLGLVSLGFISQ